MRFRSLLAGVAAFVAGTVSAAGPYDGIYQVSGLEEYYSVHQAGNTLIVGAFFTKRDSTHSTTLINGQEYWPQRNDNWDLFAGPIEDERAVLFGETALGACAVSLEFVFGSPTIVTILSIQPTRSGSDQFINCGSVLKVITSRLNGPVFKIKKVR